MPGGIIASSALKYKITRFNGVNQYVDCGNAAFNFESNQAITISCWARFPLGLPSTNTLILGKLDASTIGIRLIGLTDGTLLFNEISAAGSISIFTTAPVFGDGKWHHVVVTYTGSRLASGVTLYADGVARAATVNGDNLGAGTIRNTGPLTFGSRPGSPGSVVEMQDVSGFSGVLSAAQVTALYNGACPPDVMTLPMAGNLQGYWLLGTHVGDLTLPTASYPDCWDVIGELGHNGTMVNMSAASILTRGAEPIRINFATLFAPGSVLQAVQTDRGLTYGTALLPATGNTSTATMALSGALGANIIPVPILMTLTGASTASITYDGGANFTSVSVVAGVPITLAGPAGGLVITPSAGTLVVGNSWVATCAGLQDQSGNGNHFTQPTAARQMELKPKAGVRFPVLAADIARTAQLNSTLTRAAPMFVWLVIRVPATVASGNRLIYGANNLVGCVYMDPAAQVGNYCGGGLNPTNPASASFQFGRTEAWFGNAVTDYIKFGATKQIGPASAGGTLGTTWSLGGDNGATAQSNAEVLAAVVTNSLPTQAVLDSLDAAVAAMYPGVLL